ncbi:hypothetical protein [Paenibacillus sp. FSL L8-0709]
MDPVGRHVEYTVTVPATAIFYLFLGWALQAENWPMPVEACT